MLKTIRTNLPRFYSIVLSLSFLGAIASPIIVSADQYTQQIQAIQTQNSQVNSDIASLQGEASSYQQEISDLQTQISSLQIQMQETENQITSIQGEIVANQVKLAQEKNTLAQIIKSMYVDGNMTTLESLATSKSISDFVTKIEYQNIVQQQIQSDLTSINQTQSTLDVQNANLSVTLESQKTENSQLASEQSNQTSLLAMDQQQQATYTQQLQQNNAQISQLQQEEAAYIARIESGGTTVYGSACDASQGDTYPEPWCGATMDSLVDNWGMYNRECVSYTAWKVYESGDTMPYWGGEGDAYQWIGDAESDGIPVSTTPQAGDVGIYPKSGVSPLGHAVYVESVNSNGTINISQYNANNNGDYSMVYNLPISGTGIKFINFGG